MIRLYKVLAVAGFAVLAFADEQPDDLKKKPITTDNGAVGKSLKKWWEEGTAAGNVGDWYDNRDGEHSPLNLATWPQTQKVPYSEDDVKARRHWALMLPTRERVTFGNSSTSAPPQLSGSNPRSAYCNPNWLAMLEKQYLGNNLYIYPEHRDHDPGHNGVGDGYGDLYPTNTPYLLISQGSSGSDQPFMRAIPFTLAAFRPDVKKKLVENGLLMPTVQMILRRSNKNVADDKAYLSGKAHPSVFEGANVDVLKMVELAHEITADKIPPLVRLKVTKEDVAERGKDYFDHEVLSEQHSDTSSVVARVWRGSGRTRTLTVSAESSKDVNKKELTFTWVLLRGDEKRVRITPKDRRGVVAEISVDYHERRPIEPGSKMESNRVDVGVFAHNGAYHSAPAFVTFYSLDSEARTYDDKGRVVEIGYGQRETELSAPDLGKLFARLGEEELAAKVLGLTQEQRKEFAALGKSLPPVDDKAKVARKGRQEAETARNKTAQAVREAEKALAQAKAKKDGIDDAEKALAAQKKRLRDAEESLRSASARLEEAEGVLKSTLDDKRDVLKAGARPFALAALHRAMRDASLWNGHVEQLQKQAEANKARQSRIAVARKRLVNLGIVADGKDDKLTLTPARGKGERLTLYEQAMLEQFNAIVLSELVLPGAVTFYDRLNFVDGRLTAPKAWRDVYHADGGWTRYSPGAAKPAEFTAEGWLVTKKDEKGRPLEARTVVYRQAPPPKGTQWVNPNPLEHGVGDELITFAYDGDKRSVKGREKVFEK